MPTARTRYLPHPAIINRDADSTTVRECLPLSNDSHLLAHPRFMPHRRFPILRSTSRRSYNPNATQIINCSSRSTFRAQPASCHRYTLLPISQHLVFPATMHTCPKESVLSQPYTPPARHASRLISTTNAVPIHPNRQEACPARFSNPPHPSKPKHFAAQPFFVLAG